MHGDFTWIDLSTFDVPATKKFYGTCFGWEYSEDESGYVNGARSGTPCAGLYEMPEFFQKINMPSFWMTYISVTGIDSVVAKAKELGRLLRQSRATMPRQGAAPFAQVNAHGAGDAAG